MCRTLPQLREHQDALRQCRRCPSVTPPVVTGEAVISRVYLLGQAPGVHEGPRGRPFAHTAGRTLFRWLAEAGADEMTVRSRVYMAAVLRCFPGKAPRGGDRVPNRAEIARCAEWIVAEHALLRPTLVLAVGKLAIAQVLGPVRRLDDVVGPVHRTRVAERELDCIALPHPSGVSAWPKREPGKGLLNQALRTLRAHPAWRSDVLED